MSTRALISYIPTLDIEVQFDPNLLPAHIHDWIRWRSERRKMDEALKVAQENSRPVTLKKGKTYSIYCHNDGGLDGVGATLLNFFSREELIENLIAAGDCSSVSGIITPYTSLGEPFKAPSRKTGAGGLRSVDMSTPTVGRGITDGNTIQFRYSLRMMRDIWNLFRRLFSCLGLLSMRWNRLGRKVDRPKEKWMAGDSGKQTVLMSF